MEQRRNTGIDYLRGFFILLIFISHSADFPMVTGQSIWGAAGVTGFFILSGFLYSYTYKPLSIDGNLKREIIKNIQKFFGKFYPFYFVVLCAYVFVRPSSYIDFIKCIFLTQSYWGDINTAMSFNGNAWFLSSLMFCYWVCPVLNKLIKNISYTNLFILMLGAFCIQVLLPIYVGEKNFEVGYYWVYICPLVRLIDFFEGMLLFNMLKRNVIKKLIMNVEIRKMNTCLVGGVILVYFIKLLTVNNISLVLFRYNMVWVLVTELLIVIFFLTPRKIISRLPLQSLLIECGKLSFEIFLCHRLVLLEVAKIDTGLCAWMLALGMVIIIAYLVHSISNFMKKVAA